MNKKKATPPKKLSSKNPRKPAQLASAKTQAAPVDEACLLADLRSLVHSARHRVATVANSAQTLLFWHVGRRLLRENLQGGRAAYGKQIVATVSQQLMTEFGRGFSYSALTRMVRFAESMAEEAIVASLSQQLSWSHFLVLLPLKDPLARDFYAEMCRIEQWDVRTLRQKIGGLLFQRTALSKQTRAVISTEIANLRDGRMSPDVVFRDPYMLDFLGLQGAYSEHDLEEAILPQSADILKAIRETARY